METYTSEELNAIAQAPMSSIDVCKGERYNRETLQVKYQGKSLAYCRPWRGYANDFASPWARLRQQHK